MRRIGAAAALAGTVVLAAVLCAAQQPAQAPGQTVFKASINLVEISVVVRGPDGRPVHGLSSGDFTILDRGTPRPVAAFVEIADERPARSLLPSTLIRDVSDNASAKSDRVVILVLDDLHLKRQTDEVKAMARRVVEGLGTGTSIGLITTSGTFGMEPTSDRARILDVIDRFVAWVVPRATPMPSRMGDPGDLGSFFADMTMFKASQDVARMLVGQDTQRKAFVWLSKGVQKTCPEPKEVRKYGLPTWYDSACDAMLHQMQRANVSTYAVDPGGGSDHFLSGVSDATGGFAVGANDLDAGLDRILDDLNNYYLLGFTPPDAKDTSYHTLEVTVDRGDLSLRYRRGYQAAEAPLANPVKVSAALVGDVLPKTDLRLRLFAAPLAASLDGATPVVLCLEAQGDAARLRTSDGGFHDAFHYQIVAVNLDKKKIVTSQMGQRDITWHQVGSDDRVAAYQVETYIDLPPGTYQLRASGESAGLGTAGSVYLVVDVPDTRHAALSLGGLVIGYVAGARLPMDRVSTPPRGWPFDPTIDRQFTSADALRILCEVSRPATAADADVTLEVVDKGDRVVRSVHTVIGARDGPRIDLTLPLDSLPTAGYQARLTVVSGSDRATREVGFVVN
ncbi:MAG TPA: VWA domain-containing protein [Vicinamibacterales bacterium]